MSDPRLLRLGQLWQGSLEAGLSDAEEAELQALLGDAALAEAWVEQQAGAEAEPAAALGPVPGSLRSAFQRQFQPWTYWGKRAGVPLAVAACLWLAWPKSETLKVQEAAEDDIPYRLAQPRQLDERKPQRQELGPPPGLDQHQHLWQTRSGEAFHFDLVLSESARLQAVIVDGQGRRVQTLDFGQRPQGPAHLTWDGRVADGQRAPAGHYRVQIRRNGALGEESDVLIQKN